MASFRSYVWDPVLLVAQMITMQCIFYVCLGGWLCLVDSTLGLNRSVHQLLDHREVADFANGRPTMLASSLNCLTCAIGLRTVIGRSKQCFDFASTLYFFHVILTSIYSGLPTHWGWWVLNGVCLALTTVLDDRPQTDVSTFLPLLGDDTIVHNTRMQGIILDELEAKEQDRHLDTKQYDTF